jgi:translation initiation factor 4B
MNFGGEGDGKSRDFSDWSRKGPLSPLPPREGAGPREGGRPRNSDAGVERRDSPAWGEGRSQDGSRPPRREFQDRPQVDRTPTAPEIDNEWRKGAKPDAPASREPTPNKERSTPASPVVSNVRPRLNLAKRSESVVSSPTIASTPDASSKASPFGAARPIDTDAKLKEIEEKRVQAVKEKKEADDKIKEEKRLAREAAKAEKAASSKDKENGEEKPKGSAFEILGKEDDEEATEEGDEDEEPAPIVDDKAVKPKEITRDIPSRPRGGKQEGGSWRGRSDNKKSTETEPPKSAASAAVEDDGWSTVSAKPKNNRKGGNTNGPSRAIAS